MTNCYYCGLKITNLKYYRDAFFHDNQTENYYYCGPNCSTAHYENTTKENKKTDTRATG
jgi:hypothetical protein